MKKFITVLSAITLAAALTVGSSAAYLGDVDKDGSINSVDALSILKHSVGFEVKNFDEDLADVNGDGNINSADALTVLNVSVGILNAETILSDKEEILKFYNETIDKTYAKAKKITFSIDDEYDYTFDDNETEHIKDVSDKYEVYFTDGADEDGYTPYAYAPNSELDLSMLSDIRMRKRANGYVVELTIKDENTDYMDDFNYQIAGGMPIIYVSNDEFDYVLCSTNYPATHVVATIDWQGYIESFYVDVPYTTNSYIEYLYDGEVYHSDIKEVGRRQHYIDILV